MKLCEIEDIKYKTFFQRNVSSDVVSTFIKNRLYVPGWTFRGWFERPQSAFKNGAYFSILMVDQNPQGLAILNLEPEVYGMVDVEIETDPKKDQIEYDLVGHIGFFITRSHRKSGHAKTLAQKIENLFLRHNPKFKTPSNIGVVICTDNACPVAKSAFKKLKVITHDQSRSRDHIKNIL